MRETATSYFYKGEEATVNSFMDDIDWEPFHQYLQQLGFDTALDVSTYTDYGKHRLHIRGTDNLVEKTGIMQPCFESVYLQDFGTFLFRTVDYDADLRLKAISEGDFDKTWEDFDGKFGPITLQVNMDFRFKQKGGGENGVRLFSAEYTHVDGWKFFEA